jgi:peptidoglycan/LPS O-acetylase OafA/YrhL
VTIHAAGTEKPTRRYDLDWLRVLSIAAVFVFHCARPFNGGWHVSAPETTEGFVLLAGGMVPWLMPIIFVISGAALTLDNRMVTPGRFLLEKVKRLFVPLVFGVLFLGPIMVYLERLSHGQFQGSLIDFLPHYFDGWYGITPGGNFAWMGLHLWYLLVLFVYTLLCWPLFRWFKSSGGTRALAWLGRGLSRPGVIYTLAIPLWIILGASSFWGFLGSHDFGGMPLPVYLLIFIYGFILLSSGFLQVAIQRQRWVSLSLAVASGAWMMTMAVQHQNSGVLWDLSVAIFGWMVILAAFGFAMQKLTFRNRFLDHANEGVLPFYIMHQTIILIIAYFVLGWGFPVLAQYGIILIISLSVILAIYVFLVRRFNWLRFLFGMKPSRRDQAV